jgi:hypothetical protein
VNGKSVILPQAHDRRRNVPWAMPSATVRVFHHDSVSMPYSGGYQARATTLIGSRVRQVHPRTPVGQPVGVPVTQFAKVLILLVGVAGFEPATPSSRTR